MKLNVEIIFDNLREQVPARLLGIQERGLHLGRPEHYLGTERTFHAGRFYVLRSEQLPQRSAVEKGAAILCIGKACICPITWNSAG